MFENKPLWIAVAFALGASGFALVREARTPKVGIVDNAVLVQQFSEAIKAREELRIERKKWTENTRVIEDSLKTVMDALGKAEQADARTRQALTVRLEKWNKEYNQYSSAIQQMAPKLEAEKLKPVLEKLNMYVQTWGREHGYAAILGTGTGGVILMREPAFDVTLQVLGGLNALYSPASTPGVKSGTGGSSKDTSRIPGTDAARH